MGIDIVEICFGIAYWQISSIFDRVICPQHDSFMFLSVIYLSLCIILQVDTLRYDW